MPVSNRAAAVEAVTARFADRFPDGRFAADFAETLVLALEDLGFGYAAAGVVSQLAPKPAGAPSA